MKLLAFFISLSVIISCQTASQKTDNRTKTNLARAYWPTKEWKISSPEEQGLNQDTLKRMIDLYGQKGSFVIVRNGYIVAENYPLPVDTNFLHHIHSCTKSVTSILVGIAIDKGIITSKNDTLLNYFRDFKIKNSDSLKQSITLHHALSMSMGQNWKDGIGGKDLIEMVDHQPNWNQFILDAPMLFKPGTEFNYSCGATQLLSAIIQRESKMKTKDFAKEFLFDPLGIRTFTWDYIVSPEGITPGAWGLFMRTRDMAKIGYLFLNNGLWDGKQIVSKEWVEKSIKKQISTGENRDSYGYQWWILNGYHKFAYTARGWYGDHYAFITVVPYYDLVVAIAGEIPNELANKIIKDYIIRSIEIEIE
jgi:CubicO group peptidase (beta-lactamase class C family)